MKKYLFDYKSVEEFYTYLKELKFEELCNEALTIEKILLELDMKVYDLIYYLDVQVRKKVLDDIYYQKINDFNIYYNQTIVELDKYLFDNVYTYLKNLVYINNFNNNSSNVYIKFPLKNKEDIIKDLINLYSSFKNFKINQLNDWNFFACPRKPYAYKVIHLIYNNISNLILKMKKNQNICFKELLIEMTNQLKYILEASTSLIIDTNKIFKKYISKDIYGLLEKYNCLETLGLVKYPSVIAVDYSDIFTFFKNSKIIKIIDGNTIHKINDGKPDKCIFVYSMINESMNEIFNVYKETLNKYDCNGENVFCVYQRINRNLIILAESIE